MQSLFFISALGLFLAHIFIVIHAYLHRPRRRPPDVVRLSTASAIGEMLHDHDIPRQLRSRALPNERLIRAFNITGSTFTSSSVSVHREFKRNSLMKLRTIEFKRNGEMVRDCVDKVVQAYLPNNSYPLEYDAFVQSVVFVAVLLIFFDYSATTMPEVSDVHFVTQSINILWVSSKKMEFEGDPSRLERVNRILGEFIPLSADDPFSRAPLKLILPAYETLWRLVAHAFSYVQGNKSYTQSFKGLYVNPTPEQFNSPNARNISAHDIVQEALRLHPPTKRIKRVATVPFSLFHRALSIFGLRERERNILFELDIESLQRSSVWDPLPHEFNPERHRRLNDQQRAAYMPFSTGVLRCIAYPEAPFFAGIILAALAERGEIVVVSGKSKGDREGWEGWEIRNMNCKAETL